MSSFDKREEGFEKKFAMDAESKFKAEARRNKLLGLWAAEKLGIAGDAAAAYAKEVVAADFEEAGDGDVLRKVAGDLAAKGDRYHRSAGSRQDGRADGAGDYAGEGGDVKAKPLNSSSRRRPGPITTVVIGATRCCRKRPIPSASRSRRLWVPAFAGTTRG